MAGYSLTISATDAASGVLDGVNKRIEALNKRAAAAWAPFKHLGDSVERFTKVSGIDRIAGGFKDVADTAGSAVRSLFRVIEPLAAITGAASLAGMVKLVGAWGDFAATLGIQASRAGMAADSLFALQNAARLANVSGETLTQGMTALNDNLRNAAFGAAPQFLAVLRNLGVSYDELKRQTPEQQVRTLATALGNVRNVTDRALYTKELFGGEGMIPFLNQSGEGIGRLLEQARHLGGVLSPDDLRRAQEFNTAQQALIQSVSGLGHAIGATLAPVLTPMLGGVTETVVQMRAWVEQNQAWLRAAVSDEIGKFVTWLKAVDWAGIGTSIKGIGDNANAVASALGGWGKVGEGVLAFFAVRFLAGMLAPFVSIGAAVTKLALAITTELVAAFGVAGTAAETFSKGALALPIFKALGLAAALPFLVSGNPQAGIDGPNISDEAKRDWFEEQKKRLGTPYQPSRDDPYGQGDWRPTWLGGPEKVEAITDAQAKKNMLAMDRVFRTEGGMTREGSAGLLGGFMQESGFNPRAGLGKAHQGIAQWSDKRRALIEKQFGKRVLDMNPEEQARAALWELNTQPYFAAINRTFKTTHDVGVSNKAAAEIYENPREAEKERLGLMGPGNMAWEIPKRLGYALDALADLPAGEAAPLPSAAPGAPGAPGASGQVRMNVTVTGAPANVTAQTTGPIDLLIRNPGLVGVP